MENYIVNWSQFDLNNGNCTDDGCVFVRGMRRTKRLIQKLEEKFDNLSITVSIFVNTKDLKPYKNIPLWEEDLLQNFVYSDEDMDNYLKNLNGFEGR